MYNSCHAARGRICLGRRGLGDLAQLHQEVICADVNIAMEVVQ